MESWRVAYLAGSGADHRRATPEQDRAEDDVHEVQRDLLGPAVSPGSGVLRGIFAGEPEHRLPEAQMRRCMYDPLFRYAVHTLPPVARGRQE